MYRREVVNGAEEYATGTIVPPRRTNQSSSTGSILLLNVLFRYGAKGDEARTQDEACLLPA